ncbi:MAG: hypothetical protein ACK4YU_09125, partial [Paracoccus sp. (in: a-proteobacteria)]
MLVLGGLLGLLLAGVALDLGASALDRSDDDDLPDTPEGEPLLPPFMPDPEWPDSGPDDGAKVIDGTDGDDILMGSPEGDVIRGGDGDDDLRGGLGDDTIHA